MAAPSKQEIENQIQRVKFFAEKMGYRLLWVDTGDYPTDFDAVLALPPNEPSNYCWRIRVAEYRQKGVEDHTGNMGAGHILQRDGWDADCLRTGIMIENHKLRNPQPFLYIVDIHRWDGSNEMRFAVVRPDRLEELRRQESHQQARFNDHTHDGQRKRSPIKLIPLKWFEGVS